MKSAAPTLGHRIQFALWAGTAAFLRLMNRPAAVRLADAMGWTAFHVFRLRRPLVMSQMEAAVGDGVAPARLAAMARRAYQNSILTFFEFIQPGLLTFPDGRSAIAGVEGLEYGTGLIGSPALVVTGHLGNWEALAALLGTHGVEMVAVAKPMHNPLVQARVVADRARHRGLEIALTGTSMKTMVDATRAGKWLGFPADQDAGRRGVFIDFLGQPASTATGAGFFAWKLGLPILPAYCVRDETPGRPLRVFLFPPIRPDTSAEREAESLRLTIAHTAALEEMVRRFPSDYFWFHRRWKTRPKPGARPETDEGPDGGQGPGA